MYFTFYKQQDSADCGPTCLRMVARHYGKDINIDNLRQFAGIDKEGVNLLGIAQAAENIGFKTASAKITFEELLTIPLPAILYWGQKHFVVLIKAKPDRLQIADPALGITRFKKELFLEHWVSTPSSNNETAVSGGKGIALLLEPTTTLYQQEDNKSRRIGWGYLKKYLTAYKVKIFQVCCFILLGSLLQLVFPYLAQNVVDKGIKTGDLNFIQLILLAQLGLIISQTTVEFIRSRILLFISTHINLSILSDFWTKLMRLPLSFFDTKRTGDLMQRINDHRRIEQFITGIALQTVFSFFTLIIFSVVLFRYNKTIFFVFLIGSLVYLFWIRIFLNRRRQLDYSRFAVAAKGNSATVQLIYGMQEIKLNNAEELKQKEWKDIQAKLFKFNFKSLTLNQYQQAGALFINGGKNILITYLVAVAVVHNHLTLGEMMAIQYIIGQLNSPIEQLVGFTQQAQDAKISLERLNEIHQLEDEEKQSGLNLSSISGVGKISFNDLSFAYPGAGNPPVLKNINLEFPLGKVTALVGISGSGKTTILKLIQKFYAGYAGEIKIGKTDLKDINPRYWRSISGSVMQDGYIFNDSIEKNIAIADENPDKEKLVHACKVANILEYIESLPLGFNSRIGAEGSGISAGQKQRILIARAVYKNPKYLFFDEATNALDANNEKTIMENLQEFFTGRTVIVVAHRLSTVKNADKIIILEDGQIIEEGNHQELITKKGKYYSLVKNQLELEN